MPKIKLIVIVCRKCQGLLEVRSERLAVGQPPLECYGCGERIDALQFNDLAEKVETYNRVVVDLEAVAAIDGIKLAVHKPAT